MKSAQVSIGLILALALIAAPGVALAHITPPVVLMSERDAVLGMTSGATRFFVREVRLTPEERDAIQHQWGWQPEDEVYRFYLGRDEAGQLVAAVAFLRVALESMPQFYAQVVASLIQRGAILFDVAVLKRGGGKA